MKLALALAAVAVLAVAVPSSPLACEAPGPCPFVDVCDGPDCDAPASRASPVPQPKRCDAPECDAPAKAACDGPGCDAPAARQAVAPADPQGGAGARAPQAAPRAVR
jgi:hypothetical protein